MADDGGIPDWRDASAYAPLAAADRSVLAWEWLRRVPGYRVATQRARDTPQRTGAVRKADPLAREWGLHSFEPPQLAAPAARPLWTGAAHRAVLSTRAGPPDVRREAFDLARLAPLTTCVRGESEYWLLSDGLRMIRLDVSAGTLRSGPVELCFRIDGISSAEASLHTMRQLLALYRRGEFSSSLHGCGRFAAKSIVMLRALDAMRAGATQRELAAELISPCAREARWRVAQSSLRSRAQRLVRNARLMHEGGYRLLLR